MVFMKWRYIVALLRCDIFNYGIMFGSSDNAGISCSEKVGHIFKFAKVKGDSKDDHTYH